MNFKIGEFVEDAIVVNIYTFDFLKKLSQISLQDAQILKSQILNTANVYGIDGRNEACSGREWLFALPSKYEDGVKITSRYRLYYWVLNGSTIIIGGGCHKPEKIDGIEIKTYQEVPECEDSAEELCTISKHIEMLEKKYGLSIDEIDKDEILEL
jgi:hypothetical protein